jgi:hypothetical protein
MKIGIKKSRGIIAFFLLIALTIIGGFISLDKTNAQKVKKLTKTTTPKIISQSKDKSKKIYPTALHLNYFYERLGNITPKVWLNEPDLMRSRLK